MILKRSGNIIAVSCGENAIICVSKIILVCYIDVNSSQNFNLPSFFSTVGHSDMQIADAYISENNETDILTIRCLAVSGQLQVTYKCIL